MKHRTCITIGIIGEGDGKGQLTHGLSLRVADSLAHTLEELINSTGATSVLCAPDAGVGLIAAETLIKLKGRYPALSVSCVIPDEEQAIHWNEALRNRYFDVIEAADRELLLRTRPATNPAELVRDYLEEHAELLLSLDTLVCASLETAKELPVA